MKIETKDRVYSIEILDKDTIYIKMNWGPDLKYSMSVYRDIEEKSQTILWDKTDDRWISLDQKKYFDKIVKYKAFI